MPGEELATLNERLSILRALQERRALCDRMLAASASEREALDARREVLARALDAERGDVARLEGVGLTALFYRMLGTREAKLDAERREALAAELKYDEVVAELAALDARREEIREARRSLAGLDGQLAAALEYKARWLFAHGGEASAELFALSDEIGQLRALLTELDEAKAFGRVALGKVLAVLDALGSAESWGTLDMVGGGLLVTMAKHSKIDQARSQLTAAQIALADFERELRDVQIQLQSSVEIGGFSTFADHVFDGLIFDWAVQAKIVRSKEAVQGTFARVEDALATVSAQRDEAAGRLETAAARRLALIEGFG